MTQTTTDYLFQITPLPDRPLTAGSSNAGADRFGDHLSQASTLAGDEPRTIGNGAPQSEPQSYNDWGTDESSYEQSAPNAGTSEPAQNEEDSAATAPSPQPDGESDAVNGESPADPADGDDETDSPQETGSALPIAAPGVRDSQPGGIGLATRRNGTFSGAAKAISQNVKATSHADGQTTTDNAESPESAAQRAAQAGKLVATDAALIETEIERHADVGGPEQPSDVTVEAKQAKAKKSANARSQSILEADAKDGEAASDALQAPLEDASDTARNANQKITTLAHVNSKSTGATAENASSDAGKSSEDESRRESRNDSRAGTFNTANATSKAIVALASGASDVTANAPSKNEENESVAKPISAKADSAAAAVARLSRTNAGANRNSASAGANDSPRVDPARFVSRVAKAFQTAQDRGGTLQLRLSPPELGALRLELSVKDGVMSAALQTENANARRLLLDHLPALRDRLAEQNIRVDRFDVDVRREGTGGQADTRGSQQQQFQHQPDQPAPRRQTAPQPQPREMAPQEIVRATPNVSDAGLNLIV